MKVLFDKHPVVLDKNLAFIIGLNEAIIIQQVHYWLELNKKANRNFHEGRHWTYNTYEEWNEQFPFWSKTTIKRIFKKLRDMNLLIVDRFNVYQMDRTLWYTIDYDVLDSIMNVSNESNIDIQNKPMEDNQNETMDESKTNPAIPENTTKISTKNINPSINQEDKIQEIDRQIDPLENPKIDFQTILSTCQLDNISSIYRDAVHKAIYLLVYQANNFESIRIGDVFVPQKIAKEEIKKLDFSILEHALERYKDAAKTTKINSVIGYLKSCIYNAITETDFDYFTMARYDLERDMENGNFRYLKEISNIKCKPS